MNRDSTVQFSVSVKISSEKSKVIIAVNGDISGCDAKYEVDMHREVLISSHIIIPEIVSVPHGYRIDITERKSIKNYLDENGLLSCFQIFSICGGIKKVFEEYGTEIIKNLIFDYRAVFTAKNIDTINFIYVPFSHLDTKKARLKEFLRILFVHMDEQDSYSEHLVMRLIENVTRWEKNGYDKTFFGEVALCIDSFMDCYYKENKKDIFSKGLGTIKQLMAGKKIPDKVIKSDRVVISFSGTDSKKEYSFIFDMSKNVFFSSAGLIGNDISENAILKIGRDKSWADMHIPDMTVSGNFGIVKKVGYDFFLQVSNRSDDDLCEKTQFTGESRLEDGSCICIGKCLYKVNIKPEIS